MRSFGVILALLVLTTSPATAELTGDWWPDFHRTSAGTDGPVYASCYVSGLGRFVGGDFDHVGELAVANIFKTNEVGNGWDYHATFCEPVGSGLDGPVRAMASFNGELIVGGDFTWHLARWNGSKWMQLGSLNDTVWTLYVANGKLHVGGDFYGKLKVWNGSSWNTYGTPSISSVRALTHFNGQLVGAGYPADLIFVSSGSSWDYLYPDSFFGWSDVIHSMVVFQDQLYVGGELFGDLYGANDLYNLGYWDGTDWHGLYQSPGGPVHSLLGDTGSDYLMLVGGDFPGSGAIKDNLGHWDGTNWVSWYGVTGTDGPVLSLSGAVDDATIGGSFEHCGGVRVGNVLEDIYVWGQWRRYGWLGEGLSHPAWTLAEFGETMVAGGMFLGAGDQIVMGVARWETDGWAPLGEGLGISSADVQDLIEFDGALFAAGHGVKQWDGTEWTEVGGDFGGGSLRELAVYDDMLHVGGSFSEYDGDPSCFRVARWEDPDWVPLGAGVAGGSDPTVEAMAVHDGDLYAGGLFESAGGLPAANIARWDGEAWSPLGEGLDDEVLTLFSDGDRLIVAGNFQQAGGETAARVAIWQDGSWTPLGDNLTGTVRAVTRLQGHLIVGGDLGLTDDPSAQGLATWNGVTWQGVAGDTPNYVFDLAAHGEQLWIAGSFSGAGGQSARNVAVFEASATDAAGGVAGSRSLRLQPAYPNPFNPHTTIAFTMAHDGPVHLSIHDVQGHRLSVLVDELLPAGDHEFTWDGRSGSGRKLPSGVYLSRLETAGNVRSGKLVLSR